jgi:hypothetical protein
MPRKSAVMRSNETSPQGDGKLQCEPPADKGRQVERTQRSLALVHNPLSGALGLAQFPARPLRQRRDP